MKLKRFAAGFVAAVMALAVLGTPLGDILPFVRESVATTAGAESYGDFEYDIYYNGTVEITKYNGSAEKVDIPAEIDGKSVASIGYAAFYDCRNLISITIPSSVISIRKAFISCVNLKVIDVAVDNKYYASANGVLFDKEKKTLIYYPCGKNDESYTIPNGVTSIGEEAFDTCWNLKSITIPNGVVWIGESAFNSCTELINITIPDSVESIGYGAFGSCNSLTSITIPDGVEIIDEITFYNCFNLTSISIPDSVTYIGKSAFYNCQSLTKITLPDGITNIENQAFKGCSNLIDITIPSSIENIDDWVFYGCYSLTSITIPDSVTSIGESAFYCCKSLTSITIPNSVTSIDDEAFEYCDNLKHIHIPYGTNYSEYSGKGSLPSDPEYYFVLTSSGHCPDESCPDGLYQPDIEDDRDNPNGVIINDGSYSLSDSNATSNGVMSSISSGEKKDMTVDGGSLVIDGGLGKTYNIGTLTIKRGKLTIRNAVVNIDNLIIYGDSEYDGLWINSSAKVNVNMYADVTGGYNRLFTLWKKQGGTLNVSGTLNVNRDLTIEKGGNFTQNAGSTIKVNGNVEFTSCYAPVLKGGTLWVKGNFTHKSAKTTADSNHKTIFFGNTDKKLSVGSFKFGKLYLTNEADNGNNLKNVLRTENAPFGIMTCDANGTPVASRGKYLKDYDGTGEWYSGWIGSVSKQFDSYGSVSNKITGIEIVDKSVEESIYAKVETYAMLMATGLPDDMTGDSRNTCITFKNIKVNYKGKEKKATISFVYKDAIAKLKEYAALLDTSFPSDGMHLSSISYFVNIGNESFTGTYKMTAATNQKLFAQECLDIIDKGWKDDVKSYVKTYSNKLCGVAYSKIKKPEFVNTLMNAYKTYGSTNEKIEKWKSLMEKTMSTFDFADKLVSVHCPTDVYIYNKNGELVGSVINNVINLDEDSDIIIFVENSEKTIYLDDEKYDIKVLANGTGTMDYSVMWIGDDGEELKSMSYSGLTVDGDHVYTQDTDNANGSQLEGTASGESITVSPTETTVGENIATNGHKLTVADNGGDDIWYCEDCGKYFSDEKGINEVNINAVSLLESISIGGAALDALNYTDKSYEYKVNAELRKPPEVTAVAKDSNAQISIEQADGLLGYQYQRTATVTVTSADGNNTSVYKIVFIPEDIVLSESDFTDTDYRDYIAGFDSNNDGILTADELTDAELPSTDHNFGEWTIKKKATCSEKGIATRTCADCDMTETASIPLVYHDYSDEWTTDKEPSCTEAGSKSHHCTRCKAKKDITSIPATGHKYVETVVEPSYSNRGYTLYECSVCGYSYKDNYEEQLIVPAVTGFASGSQTKSSAVLGWDKVSCADGYAVELYTDGKWNEVFRTSDSSVTSCTVGSLKADSIYSLRIRAFKDTDDGTVYSDYTRLAVKTKLSGVTGLKAQGVTATAVKLDWARNAGATGYIIEQYKGGKWTQLAVTKNNYTLTFTVKGLAECTPYSFRVKAYKNDGGKTNYSDYVTVKASTLLGTVKNAKVTSTTGTWITLGWDRNTGATGYVLEQYKGGRWTEIAVTKNNTTLKFTVKGLRNDTTYSFRIKAYKTAGDTTTYGSYVRVVGTTDIPNVAKFTGSAVSASAVKLDWSKNDKATGYVIEQYKGGKWTEIKAVDNDVTEITVEGLAKGTAYTFRIKSVKTVDGADKSSEYASVKVNTAE